MKKSSCLAIEAGGAILLNQEAVVSQADEMGIAATVLEETEHVT